MLQQAHFQTACLQGTCRGSRCTTPYQDSGTGILGQGDAVGESTEHVAERTCLELPKSDLELGGCSDSDSLKSLSARNMNGLAGDGGRTAAARRAKQ